MSLLLYTLTAAALLYLTHRFALPLSRWAAFILYLLPFAFVGYALLTGKVYGPIDLPYATEPLLGLKSLHGISKLHNGILSDIYCQMIPWRKAVQWSYAHGQWPLWNPFILSGDILAAAAQPAAYSPFTLLAILLPVGSSLTYSAAISFFLAGLGTYLFTRDLGCREGASLIGAAGFMFSSAYALFILWPVGFSWGFLPLVLFGVRRVCADPTVRSAAILTFALVLLVLAGHPETVVHVVFLGGIYGVFELIRRRTFVRPAVAAVIAGIVALGICAIYLLPILEAAPQTMEHPFRKEVYAKQERGASTQELTARVLTDLFPFLHAKRWNWPNVFFMPIDSAAVGSIILALAIFAIWRVRSPETWFFFVMAVFCLLMRGQWKPLANGIAKLPLLDITLNERFAFGAAASLAILGAIGIEAICRRDDRRAAMYTLFAVLVVLTAGTIAIQRANFVIDESIDWGDAKLFAELGLLGVATLLFVFRTPPRVYVPALVGLLVLQRAASDGGMLHSFPQDASYPPVPVFEALKNEKEPFRITGHGLAFIPGTSTIYELEDVRGYEAMTFAPYAGTYRFWCEHQPVWFNRVDDLSKPFLSFLNVKYAITWDKDAPPPGWRQVAKQRGTLLLENTNVIERAFIPRHVRLGIPEGDVGNEMQAETDFREHAWIRASLEPHQRDNGPGTVTLKRRKLGYDLEANMERDGWVVVSVPAWEGWRAYLDGRRVKMQIANLAFLSVYIPAGKHHVKLIYWPQSFVNGRAITFVTLLGVAAFGLISLSRAKTRDHRNAPRES